MAAVTLDAAPVVQGVGALLLLVLAGAFAVGGATERGLAVAWHRVVGAELMALAVLIPQHGGLMTVHHMAVHHMAVGSRMDHATAVDHDAVLVILLRVATAAYLCWIAAALIRLRHRPITDLIRWEHLAMGTSLAVMIFFMS